MALIIPAGLFVGVLSLGDDYRFLLIIPVIIMLLVLVKYPFWAGCLGFALIPYTIPIVGQQFGGTGFFNIQLWQLVFLVALLGIALRCLSKGRFRRSPRPIRFAGFLYLGVSALSLVTSTVWLDSARYLMKVFGAYLVIYLVTINSVTTARRIELVHRILAAGGILVALLGFGQAVLYLLFGINTFIIPENPRPTATFTEAGWFPIYLSFIASLSLPWALTKGSTRWRRLYVCALILALLGVIIGSTRGAWVAVAVVLTIASLFLGKKTTREFFVNRRRAMVGLLAMIGGISGGLLLFVPGEVDRLIGRFTLEEPAAIERMVRLSLEFELIEKRPILGSGVGTWGGLVSQRLFDIMDTSNIAQSVLTEGVVKRGGSSFNILVGALFDGGLLGLVTLLVAIGCYFRLLGKSLRLCKSLWGRCAAESALLAWVCLLINAQFNPVYFQGFFWGAIALGAGTYNVIRSNREATA